MFDFALAAWLIILTYLYFKLAKDVKESPISLGKELQENISALGVDLKALQNEIKKIKVEDVKHLQRVGFLRFNPFSETGGNQSFAVALTDDDGNGVVISSLHGRKATRVYGKPVKRWGEDGFEFSEEERKAVELAKNG